MSKRAGAKPVTQFAEDGYLPDAVVNYLARLGWSHGDDEIFSRAQLIEWFNLDHLGKSAAQFDEAKLRWVNAQHLKAMPDDELASLVAQQLKKRGIIADERLVAICALFKDRCDTTVVLANWVAKFYGDIQIKTEDLAQHLTDAVKPAMQTLVDKLSQSDWNKAAIALVIKEVLSTHALKMPQLAMPARVLLMGTPQTPSLDAVISLFSKDEALKRLKSA